MVRGEGRVQHRRCGDWWDENRRFDDRVSLKELRKMAVLSSRRGASAIPRLSSRVYES